MGPIKSRFVEVLCRKHVVVLFMAVGLLLFASGAASALSSLDITSSAGWEVRGSAIFGGTGAVIGDNIGYDSSDQDKDGNYQNQGKPGSGIDYDFIISKTLFDYPVTLEWQGCLPVTRYGYNMFGLGKLYNGGIFRQAVFQTRWENQTAIQVWADSGGSDYLSGISPDNNKFCASYKLVWDNNGIVTFYYNNQQVFTASKAIKGPLVFYARTFEHPATISSLTITSGALAPVAGTCDADPSSAEVPFTTVITCAASGSSQLTWSWDWDGDGIVDETTNVDHASHTYDKSGTYKIIVTVTDASGSKVEKTCKIVALESNSSNPQGTIDGSFTGTIKMKDGSLKQISGSVTGSWDADMDNAGNIAASAQGSFGADGISGDFQVSYDSATGQLIGSWGDASGDILSNPIVFTMKQGTGAISFSAPINGVVPTADGGLPFDGEININLLGLPNGNVEGPVDGTFSTNISYKVTGSMDIGGFDVPVNISGNVPTSGNVSGTWQVSSANGNLTGKASGKFSGMIATSVNTLVGPYPVKIPYSGTWNVILGTSGNDITFQGSWFEPNVQAIGDVGGSFGGGFGIKVDTSSGTWPIPVTFTAPVSGGTYVDPTTGLTITWQLQNLTGNGNLSLK